MMFIKSSVFACLPEQQHHTFPQCGLGFLRYFDGTDKLALSEALYAPMETIDV